MQESVEFRAPLAMRPEARLQVRRLGNGLGTGFPSRQPRMALEGTQGRAEQWRGEDMPQVQQDSVVKMFLTMPASYMAVAGIKA